jgi:radical SAM superfamily enzyme with C-terminal helix-hairpin-helix motif
MIHYEIKKLINYKKVYIRKIKIEQVHEFTLNDLFRVKTKSKEKRTKKITVEYKKKS